jgi:hypothetical protein
MSRVFEVFADNWKPLGGLFITISGVSMTFLSDLEIIFRLFGGFLGCCIGLLTTYKLLKEIFFKNVKGNN